MSDPTSVEQIALFSLPPGQAMRLALLRIAADTAPRLTGGQRIDDVVERARVLELYVTSAPPGSVSEQGTSEPAAPETAPPERGQDAGPADLRTDRAEIGGERA